MVSINRVYQKVLALANKEQRGYITPQEFNLFADQAQMEIFEQYFYDLSQFKKRLGNSSGVGNMVDLIDEKLHKFKNTTSELSTLYDLGNLSDLYTITEVYYHDTSVSGNFELGGLETMNIVEEIDHWSMIESQNSPLTRATNSRPVYYITNNKIQCIPQTPPNGGSYLMRYIRKPITPNWTYLIGNNGSALFNPDPNAGFQDFELHTSEETALVIKILQLAGVAIKDFNLSQLASQKEVNTIQQEKQ